MDASKLSLSVSLVLLGGCGATSPPPATVAPAFVATPVPTTPMGPVADLERFVTMALQAQFEAASTIEDTEWVAQREWYEAASERIGYPRSLCSWYLYPTNGTGLPFEAVPAVSVECEGTHCVAWLTAPAGEEALHLLFDEAGHLRASATEGRARSGSLPPAPSGLAATECTGAFDALLDDRFGEDLFVVGVDDDTPYVVRLCGDAATERLGMIGDDFACVQSGCVQLMMCGNTCTRIAGEVREGRVQVGAYIDTEIGGDGPPSIDAAQFSAWRGEIECGDSIELSAEFLESL